MAWNLHTSWRSFVNDLHEEGARAGLAVQEIQALLHSSFLRMQETLHHAFEEIDLLQERSLDAETSLEIASEWAASLKLPLLEARLDEQQGFPVDWDDIIMQLRVALEERLYREEMTNIRTELASCIQTHQTH